MNKGDNKRILIAGGYGLVGGSISRLIRKSHKDVELLIAGRNPEVASKLAEELGNAKAVYLDVYKGLNAREIGEIDLVIAATHDPSDGLIHHAISNNIAHIGINKLADDISPVTFYALKKQPARPIAVLGHWQAGVLVTVAQKLAEQFKQVYKIEATAVFDPADPIGVMVQNELEHLTSRALLRKHGNWEWVDPTKHERKIAFQGDVNLSGYPLATLDLPSLAAITSSPNIRFDFAQGLSLGRLEGRKASHDLYIDFEGVLISGENAKKRAVVSDSNGSSHLTALGVLVATERILGLDGGPMPKGGIYTPETLLNIDKAISRFSELGVKIRL